MTTKLDAPYTLFAIRENAQSSGGNEASGSGSRTPETETQKSGATKQLDTSPSTAETGPEDQGIWKGNRREFNMRWTQATAPSTPKINVVQRRPLTMDSRSPSRIEPENAQEAIGERKWTVEAYFRQIDELMLPTPREQRTELNESPASTQPARKLTESGPRKGRVLIGNYLNDKPHKGRGLIRGHLREEPLVRKKWAFTEAPTSESNAQPKKGHVSDKGSLRSRIGQGLIHEHAKEVDDNLDLEQGPRICKHTLTEPLVPKMWASAKENLVPEAPVRIRTYGARDEKDLSPDVQMQIRKQRISKGRRAYRYIGPGKEQAFKAQVQIPEEEQAPKAQAQHSEEEQISKAPVHISEAEHATKAKVQISDEGKDPEALVQARRVNLLVRRINRQGKLERSKAKEAAHLKRVVEHIINPQAAKPKTLKAKWEAEVKKASGKVRFVTERPKEGQSGGPYRESIKIRKHLSVGNSPKSGLDQALGNDIPATRLDTAPNDVPSALDKTKRTDEIKTEGKVHQVNLELSTKGRSNARDESRSSTQSHPDRARRFRRLYQDAKNRPEELPTMPVGGSIVKYELSHKSPLNGSFIKKHVTDSPPLARTRPTSSRDQAQDLHSKYRFPFSHNEAP